MGRFGDLVDGCGAPDAPGIYLLLDGATELLYVGKAARLRRRLRDHARAAEGCFPHLGRGVSSRPGVACSDGYPALLRLLWAASAGPRDRMPRVLTRVAPDAAEVAVDAALRRPLHDLLAGTSARLLGELAERHRGAPPLLRPGLTRDQVAAAGFFDHGPGALRRLRRAHAVGPGPLPRSSIEDLLVADLQRAIGPFRRPPADPTGALLGRRSRPWADPSALTGRGIRRRPGRGPGRGPRRPSGRGG